MSDAHSYQLSSDAKYARSSDARLLRKLQPGEAGNVTPSKLLRHRMGQGMPRGSKYQIFEVSGSKTPYLQWPLGSESSTVRYLDTLG